MTDDAYLVLFDDPAVSLGCRSPPWRTRPSWTHRP